MRVVFSTPTWVVSGVNSFTHNLMRGLQKHHDVELLVVRQGEAEAPELPLPTDVPVHHLEWEKNVSWWRKRWEAIKDHLESRPETIYFANYDFENSAVVPALSNTVGAVGIIHSDEPAHYEHLDRCGPYWNAVVSVSSLIHGKVLARAPGLASRAYHIPYGVPSLATSGADRGGETLRILFAGRFNEGQKRVSDLVKIAHGLAERGVPYKLSLAGNGPEEVAMRAALAPLVERGLVEFLGALPNDEVVALYRAYDCLVLTSNYEGLPVALLEAMGSGCIPVVSNIRSGIPDVIRSGENGYAVEIGDVDGFVARFAALQADRGLRGALSGGASRTISEGPFGIDHVVGRYDAMLERIRQDIASGAYVRPEVMRPGSWTGDFIPPPGQQISPDDYWSTKWLADHREGEMQKLQARIAELERAPPVPSPAPEPAKKGLLSKLMG